MPSLKLKVITPQKVLVEEKVDEVYSTAIDGEFGVMPGHIPYMAPLAIGVSKYIKDGESVYISTIGGLFQIKDDEVIILTDSAEFGDKIDEQRAQEAKERAEARLGSNGTEIDTRRAEMAIARATARLKAARGSRH